MANPPYSLKNEVRLWAFTMALLGFVAGLVGEPLIVVNRPPVDWRDGFFFGLLIAYLVFGLLTMELHPRDKEANRG